MKKFIGIFIFFLFYYNASALTIEPCYELPIEMAGECYELPQNRLAFSFSIPTDVSYMQLMMFAGYQTGSGNALLSAATKETNVVIETSGSIITTNSIEITRTTNTMQPVRRESIPIACGCSFQLMTLNRLTIQLYLAGGVLFERCYSAGRLVQTDWCPLARGGLNLGIPLYRKWSLAVAVTGEILIRKIRPANRDLVENSFFLTPGIGVSYEF